jgi:urea carboxylase system permease
MFFLGFGAGGRAFIWSWPLVFVGQFLVALGFAELAAQYPLSGGAYQWSKLVGSHTLGWIVGWVYMACLVVTLAAVALALQNSLPLISSSFQIAGSASNPRDSAVNAVLLGCCLIVATTLLNSAGVRILAMVNNLGVLSELLGVALLIVLLAANAVRSPGTVLFGTEAQAVGAVGAGFLAPLLASAALTASYVMYGFDTAGSLAEETEDPRRKAPRAILHALGAAATLGFLVLLATLMAAKNLAAPELSRIDGGLPWVVKSTLGSTFGTILLCDIVFAILVCGLAVQAGAVRLIFAMARDQMLPFSRALAHVSPASRTPILATIVVGVFAATILVANVRLPKIVELVTTIGVLWANLAYLIVTAALLFRRTRGWPNQNGSQGAGLFSLGRLGLPVNAAATLWSAFMVANVGWPRAEIYGPEWQYRLAPVTFTALLGVAGLCTFAFMRRRNAEKARS